MKLYSGSSGSRRAWCSCVLFHTSFAQAAQTDQTGASGGVRSLHCLCASFLVLHPRKALNQQRTAGSFVVTKHNKLLWLNFSRKRFGRVRCNDHSNSFLRELETLLSVVWNVLAIIKNGILKKGVSSSIFFVRGVISKEWSCLYFIIIIYHHEQQWCRQNGNKSIKPFISDLSECVDLFSVTAAAQSSSGYNSNHKFTFIHLFLSS